MDDLSSITDTFVVDSGGTLDDSEQIQAPTICGRAKETLRLLDVHDKVAGTRKSQTVLVHGLSGYGKTALIESFRESVCETGGLFCGGKYTQNSGVQEPFSAIMAAFSDLCDLVLQSNDFTEKDKKQIRRDLGSEAHLLQNVISNISPLLGSLQAGPIDDLQSEAAVTLFQVACKSFLRTMAAWRKEPVVVFLDDIQWMDKGSKQLIAMYLSDTELFNVMFILAYRDENQDLVNELLVNIACPDGFVDIPVGKLTNEDVATMVMNILQQHSDSCEVDEKTQGLIDLVNHRTSGNPFHVIQFMDSIQLEGLLTLDTESTSWEFDVDQIRREMMVAKSIAELLLRKIQLLPQSEQETMKVASLLGYDFDEAMLFEIVKEERRRCDDSVASSSRSISLVNAHRMGLVEKVGDACNFPHDKIQMAFQSMIDDSEEMQLQHIIGETYLTVESDDSMYRAAFHLNQAVDLIQDSEGRNRLATINFEASKYARDRSAFHDACEFLHQGLRVLGNEEERWSNDFDLTFEMTEYLAKMELTVGNLSGCKRATEETLARATSLDMKINSLLIAAECQMAGNDVAIAIKPAIGALRVLGINIPRKVGIRHVLMKFLKVKRMLRGVKDEDILQLPRMEDQSIVAASKILIDLCFYSVFHDEDFLAVYSALAAFELTLRYGLSQYSATYIVFFASVERMFLNYNRAYRFATLGLNLLDQTQSKVTECSALFMWVLSLGHWVVPLGDLRVTIEKSVDSGLQTGDAMFTSAAMSTWFGLSFHLGDHLQSLEQFIRQRYRQLCDLRQQDAMLVLPCFQAVLNLQCEASVWIDLTKLSGAVMNEDEFFEQAALAKNPVVSIVAFSFKAVLAYNFGFVRESVKAYKEMANVPPQFHQTGLAASWYFYGSLTYYEHYRQTGQRKHLNKARKWRRCLEQAQARGCPNVRFVSILHAEENSLQKRVEVDDIASLYDTAIEDMADGKLLHLEALANERAGFVMGERGCQTEALQYFRRAMELYGNGWGAMAKYLWLQERHEQYVSSDGNILPSQQVIGDILVVGE